MLPVCRPADKEISNSREKGALLCKCKCVLSSVSGRLVAKTILNTVQCVQPFCQMKDEIFQFQSKMFSIYGVCIYLFFACMEKLIVSVLSKV